VLEMKMVNGESPKWHQIEGCRKDLKVLCAQFDRLEMREAVLYRRFDEIESGTSTLQLLVPKAMRQEFVDELHKGIGHLGRR